MTVMNRGEGDGIFLANPQSQKYFNDVRSADFSRRWFPDELRNTIHNDKIDKLVPPNDGHGQRRRK